jgi:hypothetical protein
MTTDGTKLTVGVNRPICTYVSMYKYFTPEKAFGYLDYPKVSPIEYLGRYIFRLLFINAKIIDFGEFQPGVNVMNAIFSDFKHIFGEKLGEIIILEKYMCCDYLFPTYVHTCCIFSLKMAIFLLLARIFYKS